MKLLKKRGSGVLLKNASHPVHEQIYAHVRFVLFLVMTNNVART